MLLSCKITRSVLTYLERKGEDITSLLESTALPEDFLRDPSYWMPATDMEKFLAMTAEIGSRRNVENILQEIAHATPELRSWGVFDSVLRMISLQDVLAQPTRFLSYFISPEPPVDNIVRHESSIDLDLPIPADQFPFSTTYLRASFETLPVFGGKNLGLCTWSGMHLKISWASAQEEIFTGEDSERKLSPELLRSIVSQLEKHQLELQQKNAELEARNDQLRKAYQDLEQDMRQKLTLHDVENSHLGMSAGADPIKKYDKIDISSLVILKDQVARLGDYMVRAQQLITLMSGQEKMNSGIKEAMKRVDWEWVKQQFPLTMASSFDILNATAKKNLIENSNVNNNTNSSSNKIKVKQESNRV